MNPPMYRGFSSALINLKSKSTYILSTSRFHHTKYNFAAVEDTDNLVSRRTVTFDFCQLCSDGYR